MLTMLLSDANISDSVGGPGRHEDQAKDPQVSGQIVNGETTHLRGIVKR